MAKLRASLGEIRVSVDLEQMYAVFRYEQVDTKNLEGVWLGLFVSRATMMSTYLKMKALCGCGSTKHAANDRIYIGPHVR